jgi:hypothetical protein
MLTGCGTEPQVRSVAGTYSASFDPGLSVDAVGVCERFILYAILSLNEGGDFGLSVNVGDDCRPVGGQFTFFEVGKHGSYGRRGDTLSFAPEGEFENRFTGLPEGEYFRVFLPQGYGELATEELELHLGPRAPL